MCKCYCMCVLVLTIDFIYHAFDQDVNFYIVVNLFYNILQITLLGTNQVVGYHHFDS